MPNNPLPKLFKHLPHTTRWAVAGMGVIIGFGLIGNQYVWSAPKVISPTGPALGVTDISPSQPIQIVFSHPVRASALRSAIHPELKGRWGLSTNWLSGRSTLRFTPTESPDLETRYTVELSGIQNLGGGPVQKYLLSFQTPPIPKLETISPAKKTKDVLPDAPIVLTFDQPISDAIELTLKADPEQTFAPVEISGKTATFNHPEQFLKGKDYNVTAWLGTVKRNYQTGATTINQAPKKIGDTNFSTIPAPSIQNYAPGGNTVDPASNIEIEFKQAMEHASTEAAWSIEPKVTGTFSWKNETTLVFAPEKNLAKDQKYTVTLAKTAKGISGFTPDEDFSWSFTVVGLVKVTAWAPGDGATGVDVYTAIRVTFNQGVDHASAQNKFSLAPGANGSFKWSGTTMIFQPASALAFSQLHTVTIAKGVKTIKGLDSNSDFSARFTTRNQSVMLSVPAYRQAHVYSCMIAAARSALKYRGVSVSESDIISRVGIDPTQWSGTWGGSDGRWGDPETAITGPLDNGAATSPAGKQTTNVYWGYGSHWGPISRVLSSYGVGNDVVGGMTVQRLAQEIANNNPVIIWWVNGIWPSYEVRWTTPAGKSIRGVNGLHVQVVRGFTGTIDNPTSFTVTDSGYGYPGRSFDIGTFKAKWGWFGNTGIIVK